MESKEETKRKLLLIFNFYISFGARQNTKYLKSSIFIKMMSDAKIKDDKLIDQRRLDLLFC